ncbi:hypothetical protein LSO9J_180007 [Candidatus Liberibacter solanacearum]
MPPPLCINQLKNRDSQLNTLILSYLSFAQNIIHTNIINYKLSFENNSLKPRSIYAHSKKMRHIAISGYGNPDVMFITESPIPTPQKE